LSINTGGLTFLVQVLFTVTNNATLTITQSGQLDMNAGSVTISVGSTLYMPSNGAQFPTFNLFGFGSTLTNNGTFQLETPFGNGGNIITFNNNNLFTKTSTAALRETSGGSSPVTAFCFATCGPTQQFLPFVFRTSYIINFTGPGSGSCIVTDVTINGDVQHPINNTTVPASMAAPTAFTSDIKLDFLC